MFTIQELQIILKLLAQANAQTGEGKIAIGKLQVKIEEELSGDDNTDS